MGDLKLFWNIWKIWKKDNEMCYFLTEWFYCKEMSEWKETIWYALKMNLNLKSSTILIWSNQIEALLLMEFSKILLSTYQNLVFFKRYFFNLEMFLSLYWKCLSKNSLISSSYFTRKYKKNSTWMSNWWNRRCLSYLSQIFGHFCCPK